MYTLENPLELSAVGEVVKDVALYATSNPESNNNGSYVSLEYAKELAQRVAELENGIQLYRNDINEERSKSKQLYEAVKALLEENEHLELNLNGVELGEQALKSYKQ